MKLTLCYYREFTNMRSSHNTGRFAILICLCMVTGCSNSRLEHSRAKAPISTTAQTEYPLRFPIAHHGKIGFINAQGVEVINAQFDEAGEFSEGLGPVRRGKHWGYINSSGH